MMNKKEIPVGSYVYVYGSTTNLMTCQVVEILRSDTVGVFVVGQTQDDGKYVTGKIYSFPLSKLEGISCKYVHELQNIMRFLTGGELEFEYHQIKMDKDHGYQNTEK